MAQGVLKHEWKYTIVDIYVYYVSSGWVFIRISQHNMGKAKGGDTKSIDVGVA